MVRVGMVSAWVRVTTLSGMSVHFTGTFVPLCRHCVAHDGNHVQSRHKVVPGEPTLLPLSFYGEIALGVSQRALGPERTETFHVTRTRDRWWGWWKYVTKHAHVLICALALGKKLADGHVVGGCVVQVLTLQRYLYTQPT